LGHHVFGAVTEIADNGDLITDITPEQLAAAPRDESVRIVCDGHETFGLFPPDHGQPPFTLVAVLAETLRLCIVSDSAKMMLGVQPGVEVCVEWP